MKIRILLLLMILFVSPQFVHGQRANKKITITGKVTDANRHPVPGAVIFIDKVKTDIVTDEQGNYRIKVRPDAKEILVFTLFYGAAEEVINGRTNINFILTGETADNGKKTITGTIEKTSPENETTRPCDGNTDIKVYDPGDASHSTYQTIYDMIRGRFAGVEVSGKSIKIMGSSSLNVSTEPLFVVDGVIVNTIEDISPQTVKSIEVLKGPDATVYGNRGANGVIVITRITGRD